MRLSAINVFSRQLTPSTICGLVQSQSNDAKAETNHREPTQWESASSPVRHSQYSHEPSCTDNTSANRFAYTALLRW